MCVQIALVRIWLTICKKNSVTIVSSDESLRFIGKDADKVARLASSVIVGELVALLSAELDHVYERKPAIKYTSHHHTLSDRKTLLSEWNNQDQSSSDYILIETNDERVHVSAFMNSNEIGHTHSTISINRLTPLTLGNESIVSNRRKALSKNDSLNI